MPSYWQSDLLPSIIHGQPSPIVDVWMATTRTLFPMLNMQCIYNVELSKPRFMISGGNNYITPLSLSSHDRRINLRPWGSCQIHKITGCACDGKTGSVFPATHGLAIPTCITARARRTCRDACRGRQLPVSFEVGGGENVPGIPGACVTHNFTYLERSPWHDVWE